MLFQARLQSSISQAPIGKAKEADFFIYGEIANKNPADAFAYKTIREMLMPRGPDDSTAAHARALFSLWSDFVLWKGERQGDPQLLTLLWQLERQEKIESTAATVLNPNYPKFLESGPDTRALSSAGYDTKKISGLFGQFEAALPSMLVPGAKQAFDFLLPLDDATAAFREQTPRALVASLSFWAGFISPELRATKAGIAISKSIARNLQRQASDAIWQHIYKSSVPSLSNSKASKLAKAILESSAKKAQALGVVPVSQGGGALSDDFTRLLEAETVRMLGKNGLLGATASQKNLAGKKCLAEYARITSGPNNTYSPKRILHSMCNSPALSSAERAELQQVADIGYAFKKQERKRDEIMKVLSHVPGFKFTKKSTTHHDLQMDLQGMSRRVPFMNEGKMDLTQSEDVVALLYMKGYSPSEIRKLLHM